MTNTARIRNLHCRTQNEVRSPAEYYSMGAGYIGRGLWLGFLAEKVQLFLFLLYLEKRVWGKEYKSFAGQSKVPF